MHHWLALPVLFRRQFNLLGRCRGPSVRRLCRADTVRRARHHAHNRPLGRLLLLLNQRAHLGIHLRAEKHEVLRLKHDAPTSVIVLAAAAIATAYIPVPLNAYRPRRCRHSISPLLLLLLTVHNGRRTGDAPHLLMRLEALLGLQLRCGLCDANKVGKLVALGREVVLDVAVGFKGVEPARAVIIPLPAGGEGAGCCHGAPVCRSVAGGK